MSTERGKIRVRRRVETTVSGALLISGRTATHESVSASVTIPRNPCTSLRPFAAIGKNNLQTDAIACAKRERKGMEVIVDFAGLNQQTERQIRALTIRDIRRGTKRKVT